jgi:hypothetical protein
MRGEFIEMLKAFLEQYCQRLEDKPHECQRL